MNVKKLREMSGLTQTEFGAKYNIPKRTIEDWERGVRHPPQYVVELLERCVIEDMKIAKEINDMKEKELGENSYPPVYKKDFAYALEHGELDAYRMSNRMNDSCCDAVLKAIRNHFDGMHLKKDAVFDVVSEFGPDRVAFVLASTVLYKSYDGRFSKTNKEWAADVCPEMAAAMRKSNSIQLIRPHTIIASHPAVLDGFINIFRKEVKQIDSKQMRDSIEEAPSIENHLLNGAENQFGIYQIDEKSVGTEYRYLGIGSMKRLGYHMKGADYNLVYTSSLSDTDLSRMSELEMIYEKFNIHRPSDYTGHSLSVSDVVLINRNGDVRAYFVDSIGFKEIPDFVQERKQMIVPTKEETQDDKTIPDVKCEGEENEVSKRSGR